MNEIIEEVLVNIGVMASAFFIIPIIMDRALYTFAKVTYKIAHKK